MIAVAAQMIRKSLSSDVDLSQPARGLPHAPDEVVSSLLRQREYGERSTKRGVVAQRGVTTDCAKSVSRIGEAGRKADACPTANAGQHGHVLLAAMLIGRDVADDAGR